MQEIIGYMPALFNCCTQLFSAISPALVGLTIDSPKKLPLGKRKFLPRITHTVPWCATVAS